MSADRGILRLTKKGGIQIEFVSKKGKKVLANVAQGEISQAVFDKKKELEGKEVEFELVRGQPKRVREVGGTFVAPPTNGGAAGGGNPRGHRPSNQQQPSGTGAHVEGGGQVKPDFHNPYNFVPAPPRKTSDPDLGDHAPVGQDRFDPARYTGRIGIRMVAETPLLVPDTEHAEESPNGHKTFPLRRGADRKPAIPASSVRGMLRSAYEAVSNSRFGRFSKSHQERLTFRQSQPPFGKVNYEVSAWDLLDVSLRPAATINQLSPADRVFGWVRVDGDADQNPSSAKIVKAVRGLLRVGPVQCTSAAEDAVETFPRPGVPLAILSTPKPQQGRFYVAKSPQGEAQEDGLSKREAGYAPGKGLRGRKVYPHHRGLSANHWQDPMEDRTQTGSGSPAHFQEYRRPRKDGEEQRDDQNRSILGWVKPGAEFCFDLYVHNLSAVELGALLWLLDLPDDCFHRFGGGKPLGFGSVRLEITDLDVRTGDELPARYSGWTTDGGRADPRDASVDAFKSAILRAYATDGQTSFEEVPFIKAFLVACRGHQDERPTHYPRATADGQPGPPSPDGESFKWFVENERKGAQYALPHLTQDKGLPTLVDNSR